MTGSVFALLGVAFLMVIAGSRAVVPPGNKNPEAGRYVLLENLQKYDNGDLTYQMSEGNLVELERLTINSET